jgi:hypothetical protein
MAIAPNGKFLLVSTSEGVYTYLLTSDIPGTGVAVTSDGAYAIQIDSTDSWLIEAIQGSGSVTLNAIPIYPANGKNTGNATHSVKVSITGADVQPNQMVLSPDQTKVFVALGTGGTLVVPFSASSPFSGVTAINIPVKNSSNSGSALSVAVDPTNRLFYIGETEGSPDGTTGGLRAFTFASASSSAPINVSGSPIASGSVAPNFILPDASGKYVYVANANGKSNAGNVTGFAVTSSSIQAISGTAVTTGAWPMGLAEDSTDTYIFAVSETESPYLDAYSFDSTTGTLNSLVTSDDTSTGSIAVVAAP